MGNFSEPAVVCKQRVRILEQQKRFQEALFYSCAVENKRSIATFLAYLGRIEEATTVANEAIKRFDLAFDFAKILKKFDSNKAFQFVASRLSREFSLRKSLRSSSNELAAMEWLAKTADGQHDHGKVIEKLVGAFSNNPEDLLEIANYVKQAGLKSTTLRICVDMIMRSGDRMSPAIWKWITQFSIDSGQDTATQIASQAIKIIKYVAKLCSMISPMIDSFSKAGFLSEAFQIAKHSIHVLFDHLSRRKAVNILVLSKTELSLIVTATEIACRLKPDPVKVSQIIDKVTSSTFNNASFVFELCEIAKKAKLYEIGLENGKKIFVSQLQNSRKDPLVRKLTKWLLQTTYDFDQLEKSKQNIDETCVEKSQKNADNIEKSDADKENMEIDSNENAENEKGTKITKTSSVSKESSISTIVSFLTSSLKKYVKYSAHLSLLDIANFLHETLKTDQEALKIACQALEIELIKDSEMKKKCIMYFELARSIGEMETAQILSKRLLKVDPNPENFGRVASVYDEESPEWGIYRDEIIKAICKKPVPGVEDRSGSPEKSCNRVKILLQEELPADDISNFMRQEVENFAKPEFSFCFMKTVLQSINEMEEDEQSILQEIWFGGFHFNIVVSILKGLNEKSQMDFFEYLISLFPDYKSKASAAFVFALTSVIKKQTKFVTVRTLDSFLQYLKHSQKFFEQSAQELKWYELMKFICDTNKNRKWFIETFEKWKSEIKFQSETVMLDD